VAGAHPRLWRHPLRNLTPPPAGRPVAERMFQLYDVTFVVKERVRPDVLRALGEATTIDDDTGEAKARELGRMLDTLDALILECLESAQHATDNGVARYATAADAWREVRTDTDQVVDLDTIMEVVTFCTEAATGRPFTPPPSSSESPSTPPPGTASTDASDSPATPQEPTDSTLELSATSPTPR
jgi:hypothetical protein